MENQSVKKQNLRSFFLNIRKSLSEERKKQASQNSLRILSLNYRNILSFASFGSEIGLWHLNCQLSLEKRLFLPKINNDTLEIYSVSDFPNQLMSSALFPHLQEPDPSKCMLVNPDKISAVLVPGLAFDKKNHRLGYGKGFYDRFLSNNSFYSIGIGYKEQLTELLPITDADIALNSILLY